MKRPKPRRTYTWQCGFCGAEFVTENYSQRYCSASHKQRAYEARKQAVERDHLTVTTGGPA